jgi:aspartate carbamoyltransferase catalytic subunit
MVPEEFTDLVEERVRIAPNVSEAVTGADVIIILRIQRERQDAAFFPSLREYAIHYGLHSDHLNLAAPDAIVMHPGPINRGIEISSELADGSRSLILDQVTNGVAVRMAVLYLLAGGSRDGFTEDHGAPAKKHN